MNRKKNRPWQRWGWAMLALVSSTGVPSLRGQESDAPPSPTKASDPLALKQEMIRDRFKRFEDRVYRLREQLSEIEPANSARLERVLQQAGESGIADQLDQLIELLNDPARLASAADEQIKWIAEVDRLLSILLEQDSENRERKEQIERLKEYQEKLGQILEQERALRQEAAQAIMAKRMALQLDQAIKRLDALTEKQKQIGEATEARESDPQELADPQEQAADEASRLAESLESLAQDPSGESPDSEALQNARAQAGEAGKDVQSGSQAMAAASSKLGEGQAPSAKQDQTKATEALKEAREKLERAKRALEQSATTKPQAEMQKKVSDQARGLSDQMRQDEGEQEGDSQEGDSKGGQQKSGGKSGSSSTPGLQNLDRAQQEMDGASESLEQEDAEGATPKQDRAIQELEQAQRELENALQQLRQEERAEMLRDLEARFRELLGRQRVINEATVALDEVGRERFGRAQHLQLADLATQQRELAGQAETCGHILDEEGTTIVFPRVVDQIAEDMRFVGDRLAAFEVGELTQTVEAEIVDALEQLLEAVKRMQQENAGGGGQSGGGGNKENQRLLPTSAEYKLLRSSQLRVNQRTTAIEKARAESEESEDSIGKALRAIAARQKECHSIALEMRDRERTP